MTLVASSRPPRPTSSSTKSAGFSEKASSAAAVVISNWVMSSPSLTACVRISISTSVVLADGRRLAVRAGDLDALVEAHEMRGRIDVHALARRFQHRLEIGRHRALAVGAGDVDDGRQLQVRVAELAERRSTRPSERSMSFGCSSFISARSWSLVGIGVASHSTPGQQRERVMSRRSRTARVTGWLERATGLPALGRARVRRPRSPSLLVLSRVASPP